MRQVKVTSDITGREADDNEIFAQVEISMPGHLIKTSKGIANKMILDVEPAHLKKLMGSAEFVENAKHPEVQIIGHRLP